MHLGELLLKAGLVTNDQIESALQYQKDIGGHLGHILVKLGFVKEDHLMQALSEQLQIPTYDLTGFEPDPAVMKLLPREVMERLNAVPIRKDMGVLIVGVSDPTDFAGIDEVRMHAKGNVETVLVAPSKARDVLNKVFHKAEPKRPVSADERRQRELKAARKGRHGLSSLVKELERDARKQEGGVPEGAKRPAEKLADVPTQTLLLELIATLIRKGVIEEDDFGDAVESLGQE